MPYFINRGITPLPTAPTSTNTWNPSDKSANLTLSGGNLVATCTSNSNSFENVRALDSDTAGKFYWEVECTLHGAPTNFIIGAANVSAPIIANFIGGDNNGIGYDSDGRVLFNGSDIATISTYTTGDFIGVALDLTNDKIWFRKNAGGWNNDVIGTQNPATNTGGYSTVSISGAVFAAAGLDRATDIVTANFGNSTYTQTAPSGFGNWP